MGGNSIILLIGIIPTLTLIVIGALYGYGQLRRGKNNDDIQDSQRWEAAIKLRNQEIEDLQKQIDKMETMHKQQIVNIQLENAKITASLQAQITVLTAQVTALAAEKKVLADTVTGKEILDKIVESQHLIQQTLSRFEALMADGGLLAQYMANNKEMMANDKLMMANDKEICLGLTDIKKALNAGKRAHD